VPALPSSILEPLADQLCLLILDAYDRLFGLELDHLSVDSCITKAPLTTTSQADRSWPNARW
jgi:hypothetical protein